MDEQTKKSIRLDLKEQATRDLLLKVCVLQNELRDAVRARKTNPERLKLPPLLYREFIDRKKSLTHGENLVRFTAAVSRDDIRIKITELLEPIGFAQFARHASLTNVPLESLNIFFAIREHKLQTASKEVIPTYAKKFGDAENVVSGALMLKTESIILLSEKQNSKEIKKVLDIKDVSIQTDPPIDPPIIEKHTNGIAKYVLEPAPEPVIERKVTPLELPTKITLQVLENIEGDFRQKEIGDTKVHIEILTARLAMLMKTTDEGMKQKAREQLGASLAGLRQMIKHAASNANIKDLMKIILDEEKAIANVMGQKQ